VKRRVSSGTVLFVVALAARARAEPPAAPAQREAQGRRGEASVSVGVVAERRTERSELAGFLGVTLPLERLAVPRRLAVVEELEDDSPPAEPDLAAEEPGPALSPALSSELLERLARDTVMAAENAQHGPERERSLDGAGARARWSALLPEVRVRAARSRDDSLHLQPTLDDPYRYSTIGGDGLLMEAQLTFRLNRLIFADEEVALERLRIARERSAEQRAERVLARLARWHRALSRERGLEDAAARGGARLERLDFQMALDVLTGGWFGERVRHLGLDVPKVERRAPPPKTPVATESAPKTPSVPAPPVLAGLEERPVSATSPSSCLPKLATDSRTSYGASMR
jgi:hypothetical protein